MREDLSNVMCTVIDQRGECPSFVAVDVVVSFLCQLRAGLDGALSAHSRPIRACEKYAYLIYLSCVVIYASSPVQTSSSLG